MYSYIVMYGYVGMVCPVLLGSQPTRETRPIWQSDLQLSVRNGECTLLNGINYIRLPFFYSPRGCATGIGFCTLFHGVCHRSRFSLKLAWREKRDLILWGGPIDGDRASFLGQSVSFIPKLLLACSWANKENKSFKTTQIHFPCYNITNEYFSRWSRNSFQVCCWQKLKVCE